MAHKERARKGSHKVQNTRRSEHRKNRYQARLRERAKSGDELAVRMLDHPRKRAGKASNYVKPPRATTSRSERDARALRRARGNGAFGMAPVHMREHLSRGTKGFKTTEQLSAAAKHLRQLALFEESEAS